MSSPYRELPAFMLCPRCGETLDRVLEGTHACPRCQGMWVASFVLDAAFGNPKWPGGRSLWWRSELPCPECGLAGKRTTLDARAVDDIVVDQCAEHGVWLDPGELGRLVGTDTKGTEEVAELQRRVVANTGNLDALRHRRESWRMQVQAGRQQAERFRMQVESTRRDSIHHAAARDAADLGAVAAKELLARQQTERGKLLELMATLEIELATLREQQERIAGQLASRQSELATANAHYARLDDELEAARKTPK